MSDEELSAAEDQIPLDQFPEWQHQILLVARDILDTDHYIKLPSPYEIHEYRLMEQFCHTLADDALSDTLSQTLKGRGAFRRFKDHISRYGLEQAWYAYRENALKEIAIAWCLRNEIAYQRDDTRYEDEENDV